MIILMKAVAFYEFSGVNLIIFGYNVSSNKLKTSWNCIRSQLRSENVIRGHVGNSSEII